MSATQAGWEITVPQKRMNVNQTHARMEELVRIC